MEAMEALEKDDLCNVYIWYMYRGIKMKPTSRSLVSSLLGMVSSLLPPSTPSYGPARNHHWLVACDYGQERVTVAYADCDEAGQLTGRLWWKDRRIFEEDYAEKTHLGKKKIPKGTLAHAVQQWLAAASTMSATTTVSAGQSACWSSSESTTRFS